MFCGTIPVINWCYGIKGGTGKVLKTYVISDIHGNYYAYIKMLEKIRFSEEDMLYVLGDILDRGPHPVRTLLDLMARPNVVCLAGNHEYMALECFQFLLKEITEGNLAEMGEDEVEKLLNWQWNGAASTLKEIQKMDVQTRNEIVEFLSEFELFEEVQIKDKDYLLVHAGLGNFEPDRPIWEYELYELVWERPDYEMQYYPDKYVITGHTPTMAIEGNPRPGYIYRNKNHIAIDCGAGFGGRLACLCLETDEEFYVECEEGADL